MTTISLRNMSRDEARVLVAALNEYADAQRGVTSRLASDLASVVDDQLRDLKKESP